MAGKIIVKLTFSEIMLGAVAGIGRQIIALKKKLKPGYGGDTSMDWQKHIEGALAEMAVAKYLNIFWNGTIGKLHPGDVGKNEVRSTHYEDGHLLLHDEDDDNARFFFVVGINGRYEIKGWIRAKDGKLKEYIKDPTKKRPCYFVPADALNPMDSL